MPLTAVSQYFDSGFAGVPVGLEYDARSYINNQAAVRGVIDIAITVANSRAYQFEINEIPMKYTSDGTATAAEIQAGLIAAVAASAHASVLGVLAVNGSNLRWTDAAGQEGLVAITSSDADLVLTVTTAPTATQPMPAGIAVCRGTGDRDLRLMVDASSVIEGVTIHAPQKVRDDTYPTGSILFPPGSNVPVMTDGEIQVLVEENVTPASAVYVRHTANGANVQKGGFRASSDSSTAVAWTRAKYRSTALAGSLARLSVNVP